MALVALGMGVGACDSGKKNAGPAGTTASIAGAPELAYLPADSDFVLGLNVAQLQQSALWKEFAPALMAQASSNLEDFKKACGFDPTQAVKSVAVGMKNIKSGSADGIIAVAGPNKGQVMGCLDKAKEEAAKNGTEISVDGEVFTIKDRGGQQMVWTFVNDSTMVGGVGGLGNKAALLAQAKGGSGLGGSKAFVEFYSKINTKESLWLLVNGNASFMADAAGMLGMKPKAVYGSVNVTDGIAVDMRVRLANGDEVKKLVELAESQAGPQVKQMFDKLDIVADGNDVKFQIALGNQKLKALAGMFGGALGGMLGAGGM